MPSHSRLTASSVQEGLRTEYPDLSAYSLAGGIEVRGSFPIRHEGKELDRFLIRVLLPHRFPDAEPVAWETGARIPRIDDRHVNPTGTLCVHAPGKWLARPTADRTLSAYFNEPLRDYFLGQLCVEAGRPWPFGELKHGRRGLLDAYGRMLGEISNEEEIIAYLRVLRAEAFKGHWPCPCGSGLIIRKCGHVDTIRELQEVLPPDAARVALTSLETQPK